MTTAVDNLAEWWSLAACQFVDPEIFFPASTTNPDRVQLAAAKAVCARCPVRSECLGYALDAGPMHGIWGGLSEEERRLLRQRRAKARMRATRQPGGSPGHRAAAWAGANV
jgi:WhiB family transcriptional regulator, redox-sensing transcriptional regulator